MRSYKTNLIVCKKCNNVYYVFSENEVGICSKCKEVTVKSGNELKG